MVSPRAAEWASDPGTAGSSGPRRNGLDVVPSLPFMIPIDEADFPVPRSSVREHHRLQLEQIAEMRQV
jgi:hypothetical protein